MQIIRDDERVKLVLGALMEAFRAKSYPYNLPQARVPQDPRHLPANLPLGGLDHARFLWHVCYYMRGTIKSNNAVKLLAALYTDHPDIFDFSVAAGLDKLWLGELLKQYQLGYRYNQISGFWVDNAARMLMRYDGDPRLIFTGVDTYEGAQKRIQNDKHGGGFLGFQEKMVSMIIYYLLDEELIEFFNFPIPIDLHVMRVTVANELLRFVDVPPDGNVLTDETLAAARKLYLDYARTYQVNPLRLCDAVWLLSMVLCSGQPGNTTLEPGGRIRQLGRPLRLEALNLTNSTERQRRAYARTCAQCVLQATCRWNVPAGPYYRQRIIILRGQRIELPPPLVQLTLFDPHG
ncbi:MAG TPA: hypothetical protein VMS08_03375 [Candidatus Saccharimonadia bacterium]|nr:hypothetical protein [Candidatus Saccharimonadia bacterium]